MKKYFINLMYSLTLALLAIPLFAIILFAAFPFILLSIIIIFYWGIVGVDIKARLGTKE